MKDIRKYENKKILGTFLSINIDVMHFFRLVCFVNCFVLVSPPLVYQPCPVHLVYIVNNT